MHISETDEFQKDFKKLKKKYRSLDADFVVFKKVVTAEPQGDGTRHWNCITRDEDRDISVFKTRMMCRAVRGTSFRVIYMYSGSELRLLFIEIYFKGHKTNEDSDRIRKVLMSDAG